MGWVAKDLDIYIRVTSHSSSESIALVQVIWRVFFRDDFAVFVARCGHCWDLRISMGAALSKYKPRRFIRIGMRVRDFVVQIK